MHFQKETLVFSPAEQMLLFFLSSPRCAGFLYRRWSRDKTLFNSQTDNVRIVFIIMRRTRVTVRSRWRPARRQIPHLSDASAILHEHSMVRFLPSPFFFLSLYCRFSNSFHWQMERRRCWCWYCRLSISACFCEWGMTRASPDGCWLKKNSRWRRTGGFTPLCVSLFFCCSWHNSSP